MRRFVVLVAVALAAALVLVACGSKSETLKLVGHSTANGPYSIDNPPKGGPNKPPSPGDQFGVAEQLTRNGKAYGSDAGSCTAIMGATASCNVTLKLPKGHFAVQGLVNFSEKTASLAITGGTGKYKNARGFVEITNTQQETTTPLTIHLTY